MTFAQKLLMIIGIIFTSVGAFILALTLGLNLLLHDGALFMILPIAFLAIGLGFIIGVLHQRPEKVQHTETWNPLSC